MFYSNLSPSGWSAAVSAAAAKEAENVRGSSMAVSIPSAAAGTLRCAPSPYYGSRFFVDRGISGGNILVHLLII
jgi:hypothetical protein